jgi:hypothetical protein
MRYQKYEPLRDWKDYIRSLTWYQILIEENWSIWSMWFK